MMYQTAFTPEIEELIRATIKAGNESINCRREAEREEKVGMSGRDPESVYYQLTESARHHNYAADYNCAKKISDDARGRLEQLQDDADWCTYSFQEALVYLTESVQSDEEVHRDLDGMEAYVFRPWYEDPDSDDHRPLEYRLKQIIDLLDSLLSEDGRKLRDSLLKQAKACGLKSYHGKPSAPVSRRIDHVELFRLVART